MMEIWIEGAIAAQAAMESGHRPVHELLLRQGGKPRGGDAALIAAAGRAGVEVRHVGAEEIDTIASGRTHGGVLLRAGPRAMQDAEQWLDVPFLFCLEGVEDPFNLGQAVRALWAAGVRGVLLPERDWSTAETILARASAGAWDRMPVAALTESAVSILSEKGVRILCAEGGPKAQPLYKTDLTGSLLLAVGGERRGISRFVLEKADGLVRIPYGRMFPQALPTTVAASVLAFEALRQRTGERGNGGARSPQQT